MMRNRPFTGRQLLTVGLLGLLLWASLMYVSAAIEVSASPVVTLILTMHIVTSVLVWGDEAADTA